MIKRVVVAGCRDYHNYNEAKEYIDFCISKIRNEYTLVFVSGGCSGADLLGERYARDNGFKIERYDAEWDKYGRSAGPIRNEKMARAGDYVICFWDGKSRGTKSMINYAKQQGRSLKVKMVTYK